MEAVIRDDQGQIKQVIPLQSKILKGEKTKGKQGYFGTGMITLNGSNFRVNVLLMPPTKKK